VQQDIFYQNIQTDANKKAPAKRQAENPKQAIREKMTQAERPLQFENRRIW